MFADDTTLIFKDKRVESLISKVNSDLSLAANWLAESKLSLNILKTKCMLFNLSKTDRPNFEVRINETCSEKVKSQKLLGVLFDEKMS